jgi:hypothetical protein
MRRLVMTVWFLAGVAGLLAAGGCGESAPPTVNSAPSEKQAMKEGKSGGASGPAGKGKS